VTRPERRPPARWRDGWWSAARRIPSPNFGPRPEGTAVTLVVLHSISLPPGEYGGDAVERLFTNRSIGTHIRISIRSAASRCRRIFSCDAVVN
jgi:N-acetyl-anhydromuramyl-L-alanine amidase AmpD